MKIRTMKDRFERLAKRWGRYSLLAIYDPKNRDSEQATALLESAGYHAEVLDEQDDQASEANGSEPSRE